MKDVFSINEVEEVISAKETYDVIKDALKNKSRLSVMRVGDGESVMLSPDNVDWKDVYEIISRSHLGYVVDRDDGNRIKDIIVNSVVNADVLGVSPTKNYQKSVYWEEQPRIINEIFKNNNVDVNKVKLQTTNLHFNLLKYGYIDKILSELSHVVIISSRDIQAVLYKKYPNLKNIEQHTIPMQFRFDNSPQENRKFFPDVYNDIIEKIKSQDRTGQVLLFGSGFVGKGFGSCFKNSGGIAVDLGSVFDMWAGKRTRGDGRGVDAVNLDYALDDSARREIFRKLKAPKFNSRPISQHKNYQKVFIPFLREHNFTHVLEIGTYLGGLTLFVRRNLPYAKIMTCDIVSRPECETLKDDGIVFLNKNIFNADFSAVTDEAALNFLREPGKKLILCDGGNKALEFNCLSNYINTNDFIMAHDYSSSMKHFKKHIDGVIWNYCEITEEDVFKSSVYNNLMNYNYEEFQSIVWLCKVKIK
jgi:hypothetical protein